MRDVSRFGLLLIVGIFIHVFWLILFPYIFRFKFQEEDILRSKQEHLALRQKVAFCSVSLGMEGSKQFYSCREGEKDGGRGGGGRKKGSEALRSCRSAAELYLLPLPAGMPLSIQFNP